MLEGEDGLQTVGGVSASAQNFLGAASVGARLFLLQFGERDGIVNLMDHSLT
jgi:hypothetical protein